MGEEKIVLQEKYFRKHQTEKIKVLNCEQMLPYYNLMTLPSKVLEICICTFVIKSLTFFNINLYPVIKIIFVKYCYEILKYLIHCSQHRARIRSSVLFIVIKITPLQNF